MANMKVEQVHRRRLTLVELVAVVAILVVLAATSVYLVNNL